MNPFNPDIPSRQNNTTRANMKLELLSNVACGIILIDPANHEIVDINETAVSILGIPREEMLSHSCRESSCHSDSKQCPFLIPAHPGSLSGEYLVEKPGEPVPIMGASCEIAGDYLVEKPGGAVPIMRAFSEISIEGKRYIVECLIDITDRKKAETELKQHEDLLRTIYENASVGMALLDMNGNFYQVNNALCEMLQYTPEELLSRKYTVTHPDDLERSEYILARLREGLIRRNIMEKRYVRKDGSVIYALHNVSIIHDNKGRPFLFIIQAQDITYLKESLRRAMESDHLKTTFLQNLSHEVRTPANAVFGFFELMKSTSCTVEEQMEYIGLIRNGIEQFIFILNNIVEMSKIETHQLSVNKLPLDVATMLNELFREYKDKFSADARTGIDFSLFITETPRPLTIEADVMRLKQALGFLLDNALKFTNFGSVTLGGHLSGNQEVLLFVKDTGIGISREKQEYILNKFRQGDESSTRKYGGLGLGLTLAKDLVSLMGGTLTLTSEPGQGTSVFCSFPLASSLQIPAGQAPQVHPIENMDLNECTILIAEDNDSNFFVLQRWFLKVNAAVLRARNGLEAIEICRSNPDIDLVLMDLQMPVVNGYEATREILSIRPGLPILAQTAYSLDFDERKTYEAGCVGYFPKPLDIAKLFTEIKKHLQKT